MNMFTMLSKFDTQAQTSHAGHPRHYSTYFLKDLSHMYIKLLLERLFKDLFLENNVN